MQQKNFLLFMLLAFLLMGLWMWGQFTFWPQHKKEKDPSGIVKTVDPAKNSLTLTIAKKSGAVEKTFEVAEDVKVTLPSGKPGKLEDVKEKAQVILKLDADKKFVKAIVFPPEEAEQATIEPKQKAPPLKETRWEELSLPLKNLVLATSHTHPPFLYPGLVYFAKDEMITRATVPEEKVQRVTLGGGPDSRYYVQAVLTTRGAGLEKLVLNRFEAADWLGRPARNSKGDPEPLELVQEDPFKPSFLMSHYPQGNENEKPSPVLGQGIWNLEANTTDEKGVQRIRFTARAPDPKTGPVTIAKTYELEPGTYHINLILEMESSREEKFRYLLKGAHGLPVEGEWYTATFRNAVVGHLDKRKNLWRELQEAYALKDGGGQQVPANPGPSEFLQYAGVMNQYFASLVAVHEDQVEKRPLVWARPELETQEIPGRLLGIAQDGSEIRFLSKDNKEQHYLLLSRIKPDILEKMGIRERSEVVVRYYETEIGGKMERVATWIRPGKTLHPNLNDIAVKVCSEPLEIRPKEKVEHRFLLYHGPVKTRLLGQFTGERRVDPDLVNRYTSTLHLETLTDYRSAGFFGWLAQKIGWTYVLIAVTKLMHWLLNLLHFFLPSYLLSIILLTALVRGLMFPISRKQAMLGIKMQELAPEMKKLKEKYKDDLRAQQQAMMELYRKHNVHPLGGCLPLFLQLPVFMGLYYALQESVHFRLASFLWIKNLAAPDMLLWWGEWFPWISDPDNLGGVLYLGPFLNILPILAVALMLVQQKKMMPPPADEQQAMQQSMMKYMMVVIGFLFYKVAAGLCIYFIASSLWGMAERQFLPKKKEETSAPGHASAGGGGSGRPAPSPRGKPKPKKPEENGALQKVKDWWAEVLKQAKKK